VALVKMSLTPLLYGLLCVLVTHQLKATRRPGTSRLGTDHNGRSGTIIDFLSQ